MKILFINHFAGIPKNFDASLRHFNIAKLQQKYNNKCSFQPGIYQGAKLEYFWNKHSKNKNGVCECPEKCYGKGDGNSISSCKKVTGALFESGSVLITGGITYEQVDETYNYICNFLKEHKDSIKKPQPRFLAT